MGGLDLTRHLRELESDDRVLDELLSERLALERVLHGLLDAHASEANRLRRHAWEQQRGGRRIKNRVSGWMDERGSLRLHGVLRSSTDPIARG